MSLNILHNLLVSTTFTIFLLGMSLAPSGHTFGRESGDGAAPTVLAQTSTQDWTSILSGKWNSSTGKQYQLSKGNFHRNGYINMQLSCWQNTEKKTITPVYDCSGSWYNQNGEAGGDYKGKLYFYSGEYWYLEGVNNYYSSPDSWYGWNFRKLAEESTGSSSNHRGGQRRPMIRYFDYAFAEYTGNRLHRLVSVVFRTWFKTTDTEPVSAPPVA